MLTQQASLVQIRAKRGRLGKNQERFNRLAKQAAKLKEALAEWMRARPELQAGLAEHERLSREYDEARAQLVRVLDQVHDDRRLTKNDRAALRDIICMIAWELVRDRGDEEIKEIYNRRSRGDADAELAHEQRTEAKMMRAILEQGFGLEFGDETFSSVDELQRATVTQLEEREAEEPARKKSKRELATEARREAEARHAGKAIQEVYRALARALHPDRELDANERARKTELMQQVNTAYEANDLLQLLELQLRVEQVDQAHIDGLAEDRLEHFNRLLTDQVAQLREELDEIEYPWRLELDIAPGRKLTPPQVMKNLRSDLRSLASGIADVRRDLEKCADAKRLKAWLRELMA